MNREPDAPTGYELVLHFNTERDAEAFKAAFENLLDTAAKQWNSKTLMPAGSPIIRPVWSQKHDEQPSPLAVTAIAGARFDPPEARVISNCRNASGEVYFRGIPLTDDHVMAVLNKVADLVNSTWVHASSKDLEIKISGLFQGELIIIGFQPKLTVKGLGDIRIINNNRLGRSGI